MKISMVTISFNQAKFLEKAIRSVIDQDYDDIEYIIVDPGSTDGSRQLIDSYRGKISKIIFEPDQGPADGLNKGFSFATGEIFGFLNADDVLEPGALRQVAQFFVAHSDVDVVSGHAWVIDSEGAKRRRFYSDRFSLWMAAYGASILAQQSTFFRADMFRQTGGFNVGNRSAWDGELFVDMGIMGARFSLVPEFWSQFRIHDEGITGSGRFYDLLLAQQEKILKKITGKTPGKGHSIVSLFARIVRKMINPLDTMERLLHGPVGRPKVKMSRRDLPHKVIK